MMRENHIKALIAHDQAEKGASKPIAEEELDMSDEDSSDNEDSNEEEDAPTSPPV